MCIISHFLFDDFDFSHVEALFIIAAIQLRKI